MLIENIYFTLVNSNDEQFPDEISKYVAANDNEELCTLVERTEQNTALTSESSLIFAKQLQGARNLLENYRIVQLWIQYIHNINIAKQFIRTERTGN